jgi:hypothetical protein
MPTVGYISYMVCVLQVAATLFVVYQLPMGHPQGSMCRKGCSPRKCQTQDVYKRGGTVTRGDVIARRRRGRTAAVGIASRAQECHG